ncbi:hypothetical protein PTTG_10233, partial [Puccinia triticina 1-1 BBBD Race 1]|uniref:Uncharacterized protein n=1 Tax=Puccinia triticina (isolate 1-1 / race 1 (BBBD)) TaxID=630390 RepID=A0A0C4FAJ0_PUCT1
MPPPRPSAPVEPYLSKAPPVPKPKLLVLPRPKAAETLPKPKADARPKAGWPAGPAPPTTTTTTKCKQWRTLVPAHGLQIFEVTKQWIFQAPALAGLHGRV